LTIKKRKEQPCLDAFGYRQVSLGGQVHFSERGIGQPERVKHIVGGVAYAPGVPAVKKPDPILQQTLVIESGHRNVPMDIDALGTV